MVQARNRELAQAVRAELAAIDPPRSCCRLAEREGLGAAARGRARSPVVARLAIRLAGAQGSADPLSHPGPDGSGVATWQAAQAWDEARGHCRVAWLRGRFLAVGSLSLGSQGGHLEFVVPTSDGEELARRLTEVSAPPSHRERRGRAVLTWKRTETILAFLRLCGASGSILEIESQLVMRQLQGHLNRVLNAETANLERTVASSTRQLAVINQLLVDARLADLPPIERAVARERQAAPEASFTELAGRLGLSRARVQRAFQRLEAAASSGVPPGDL